MLAWLFETVDLKWNHFVPIKQLSKHQKYSTFRSKKGIKFFHEFKSKLSIDKFCEQKRKNGTLSGTVA